MVLIICWKIKWQNNRDIFGFFYSKYSTAKVFVKNTQKFLLWNVSVEPTVVPQAEIVQVALGGQVSLVCNAEAWPRPLVKWGKDGQEIFDSSTFSLVS